MDERVAVVLRGRLHKDPGAFVSHCLLDEDVRLLGGATRSGAVLADVPDRTGVGASAVVGAFPSYGVPMTPDLPAARTTPAGLEPAGARSEAFDREAVAPHDHGGPSTAVLEPALRCPGRPSLDLPREGGRGSC